jgi:hypothetical protein
MGLGSAAEAGFVSEVSQLRPARRMHRLIDRISLAPVTYQSLQHATMASRRDHEFCTEVCVTSRLDESPFHTAVPRGLNSDFRYAGRVS